MTDETEKQAIEATEPDAVQDESLIPGGDVEQPEASERPEWLAEKFKTPEELAKAYGELEKKIGTSDSVPDDYQIQLPEGVDENYVLDDPLVTWFKGMAKEAHMDQATFDTFLHGWITHEIDGMKANKAEEYKALGANAQNRLKDLGDWGKANLSAHEWELFRSAASNAQGIELLEALVGKTREAPLAKGPETVRPSVTADDLRELKFAKDEHGHLRASVDPDYRQRVDKAYEEFYGNEPVTEAVDFGS